MYERLPAALVAPCVAVGVVLATGACGLAGHSGTSGFAGTLHRDRIVVGGYGEIIAMASSQRMIFAASPSGLAIYDRVAQQWLPPLTSADGYPADRITAIAGDPDVEGVWIGAIGEVLFYRPGIDQLSRTFVGIRVDRIIFDRDDPSAGAWVGSAASGAGDIGFGRPIGGVTNQARVQPGDEWVRVTHAGFATRASGADLPPMERWIIAPTLESLADRMPGLASFADLLTRDEALRSWQPTSAAQVPGMSEAWLGTRGGGVYLADPLFNRARHVPFGLFEPGASALALASDGVWAASLGVERRGTGGVTFASTDLQQWRWVRGPADGSLAGLPIHDMLVRDGNLWIATERGVAHRDVRDAGPGRPTEWRWAAGQRRAYALAVLGGDVWAGTDDGLLLVGPVNGDRMAVQSTNAAIGAVRPVGGGEVRALLVVGDTMWIGSAAGVGIMRMIDGVPTVTRQVVVGSPLWLQQPVVGLARSDSAVVLATTARVGVIDLRTRAAAALPGDPDLSRIGRLTTVAIDAGTVWVGGERGAMVIDRTTGLARSVDVAGTIPELVFDIALQPDFAWLATPTGLVRIRRMPDGGVR